MLEDKAVFITGGARGLGLGIARACAARGARIVLADIDMAALQVAADELRCTTIELDIRDRTGFAAAADEAERAVGPISALFNNAGVIDSVSPSVMQGDLWDWVVDVNLQGVYNGVQAFVPRMIARRAGGWVVNTSSLAGLVPSRSGFAYHATKYAVVGMSGSLREELAHHGIGVSVVCPGQVATSIVENTRRLRPSEAEQHTARVTAILNGAHTALLTSGVPIDEAGESVVEGMLAGQPFIFTDGVWRARVEAHFAEVLACFPPATGAKLQGSRAENHG